MSRAKQKSSGWRPAEKRGTWQERYARSAAAQTAELRRDCDALRLWRARPRARCRRRGCTGEPRQCLERRQPRRPANPNPVAPRFALSAAEAAAAIAASIAALPPEPPLGEDLKATGRDGRVHHDLRR